MQEMQLRNERIFTATKFDESVSSGAVLEARRPEATVEECVYTPKTGINSELSADGLSHNQIAKVIETSRARTFCLVGFLGDTEEPIPMAEAFERVRDLGYEPITDPNDAEYLLGSIGDLPDPGQLGMKESNPSILEQTGGWPRLATRVPAYGGFVCLVHSIGAWRKGYEFNTGRAGGQVLFICRPKVADGGVSRR